jgi:hypothetical protein
MISTPPINVLHVSAHMASRLLQLGDGRGRSAFTIYQSDTVLNSQQSSYITSGWDIHPANAYPPSPRTTRQLTSARVPSIRFMDQDTRCGWQSRVPLLDYLIALPDQEPTRHARFRTAIFVCQLVTLSINIDSGSCNPDRLDTVSLITDAAAWTCTDLSKA